MENNLNDKYLPLTESTFYAMLTLFEPQHGYVIMQKVKEISGGTVVMGPGTLYGILSMLEKERLIVKVSEEERRKSYVLTAAGKEVLAKQIKRLKTMVDNSKKVESRL